MKTIFKTLFFLLAFTACKAQTITSIENYYSYPKPKRSGMYYKDLNNLFNKYEGSWLYTNGSTSLRIKLRKINKYYDSDENSYEDALIGEYEYIENGVIKVSTLTQFNSTTITLGYFNINNLNILKPYERPVCIDCDELVKRISIWFKDPQRNYLWYSCYIGLTEDPTPKLVFDLRQDGSVIPPGSPRDRRIPAGHYILTKQ